jgi:hypothetical protein
VSRAFHVWTESVAKLLSWDVAGYPIKALVELSAERLKEADVLLRQGHPSGAYYLAGYTIELLLKAILADQRFGGIWPSEGAYRDGFHHNLEELLRQVGFHGAMRQAQQQKAGIADNWVVVRSWSVTSRYRRIGRREARELLDAIKDPRDGIMQWLKFRNSALSGLMVGAAS